MPNSTKFGHLLIQLDLDLKREKKKAYKMIINSTAGLNIHRTTVTGSVSSLRYYFV